MLAVSQLATRHRLSVLRAGYKGNFNPLLSRSVVSGPKDGNVEGESGGTKLSQTRFEVDAIHQQASDKIVNNHQDSVKLPSNSPVADNTIPQCSPKELVKDAPHSNPVSSSSVKQSPPLVDQLNLEAKKASQSLSMWRDATLGLLRSRAQKAGAEAAVQFNELGGKLNKVTGYDEIEALKRKVVERGLSNYVFQKRFTD